MDDALTQFLTYRTVVFACACWIGTFFVRRVAETKWPSLKPVKNPGSEGYLTGFALWWNKLILYLLPVGVGASLSAVLPDFMPPGIVTTAGGVTYGVVIGFLSGLAFKIFRRLALRTAGLESSSDQEHFLPR
jgi:hypothetical protein